MSAYWVSRVHVTDHETYGKYVAVAGEIIKQYGGVILARGGRQVILEGGDFERSIVARFESVEAAVACYNSPEYTAARQHTIGTSVRHMVAVEGID